MNSVFGEKLGQNGFFESYTDFHYFDKWNRCLDYGTNYNFCLHFDVLNGYSNIFGPSLGSFSMVVIFFLKDMVCQMEADSI